MVNLFENAKVGDKVQYTKYSYGGYRNFIGYITRFTKTLVIVSVPVLDISESRFKYDGRSTDGGYHSPSIEVLTPEMEKKIVFENMQYQSTYKLQAMAKATAKDLPEYFCNKVYDLYNLYLQIGKES